MSAGVWNDTRLAQLQELSRLCGLQLSHHDGLTGRLVRPPARTLLAAARALGAEVETPSDVAGALIERRRAAWRRPIEPVLVTFGGRSLRAGIRLPVAAFRAPLRVRLDLEDGDVRRWVVDLSAGRPDATERVDGVRYGAGSIELPGRLPQGYHRLGVTWDGGRAEALVISAPARAWQPAPGRFERTWGAFLPLYALRTGTGDGTGTFTDLARLMRWVRRGGGSTIGTLPLLASFADRPLGASPYAPVSRLFWNELYLDPGRIPERRWCRRVAGLTVSAARRARLKELRGDDLIDYPEIARARRELLEEISRCFFERPGGDRRDYDAYVASRPDLLDYARFRAVCERRGTSWHVWPARLRNGRLRAGDCDPAVVRYHAYAQWRAHQQIGHVARAARRGALGLYLDLPLGVHPDGYDVWRWRECFAPGVSGGAPPDPFFTRGQDWGFPPLHPERIRQQGYGYYIECLRHQLRQAGLLRIDHVMGLHRLYWVPHGMEAADGVYVRYRPEEFYAILCLESDRSRTMIVGEDLGTVPPEVRPAMERHAIQRMYVLQFEAGEDPRRALAPAPAASVAALNTHDMPTFAGFWEGLDVADRVSLGLLADGDAGGERRRREKVKSSLITYLRRAGLLRNGRTRPPDVLKAVLAFLGRSPARLVMVNLEDLWLERAPQNTPGTTSERPNWRRRAAHGLAEITRMRSVAALLGALARSRKEGADS